MGAHLEYREDNGFFPYYEGIDFRALRLQALAGSQLVAAECWFIVEDGDAVYEQQITQDNCHIELNTVDPPLDRIGVQDERDSEWWIWFRDETPEFDDFVGKVAIYGKVVQTMYPQEDVVAHYLKRRDLEIEFDITNL